MSFPIVETGSVRVDLLGGTIDLWPINLILENAVTLNLATSLKAKVKIDKNQDPKMQEGLKIISKDYDSVNEWTKSELDLKKIYAGEFEHFSFVLQIISHFSLCHSGLVIELESGSPPGAGLGGSSAMGITLYKALSRYQNIDYDKEMALKVVSSIEARILNCGPTGLQDYYPALYGGVLALKPLETGVQVEQLYSKELAHFLLNRVSLVYTGEKRLSGINNWEVYKRFFDGDQNVFDGLSLIANLSFRAYNAILKNDFDQFIELISKEGAARKKLFSGIMTPSMDNLYNALSSECKNLGIKVCGAGGGGCFLLIHEEADKLKVKEEVLKASMTILDFDIDWPY